MNKNDKIKKSTYEKEFRIETKNGEVIEILTNEYTFHYDQNENILEEIYRKWSNDQSEYTIESKSYIYDKEGKLIEEYHRNGDSQHPLTDDYTCKVISSYHDEGKLVEHTYYDREGTPERKFSFINDERGRRMKMTSYRYFTRDGELKCFIDMVLTYEYDEKNHTIKEHHEILCKTSIYNEKGNLLLEESFADDKNIYEYEFDEHGEVIVKYDNYFEYGILKETEITKYDNGNIIEFITQKYDKNGKETENTKRVYTNDEYGNIIKSTYYINGELTSITRTEIEYYD